MHNKHCFFLSSFLISKQQKHNTHFPKRYTVSSALIQGYQTFQTVCLLKRLVTNMRGHVSRTCSAVSILSFPPSSRSLWTTTVGPRPSSTLASPCRTAGCPATSPTGNICRDYAATALGRYPHTHTHTHTYLYNWSTVTHFTLKAITASVEWRGSPCADVAQRHTRIHRIAA